MKRAALVCALALVPLSIAAAEIPKDAITAEACHDPQVRLLVSNGYTFPCYGESVPEGSVCTISGKCEQPPKAELVKVAAPWAIFSTELRERLFSLRIGAEDFLFSLLPQFLKGDVEAPKGITTPFSRSAAAPAPREAARPTQPITKSFLRYEAFMRHRLLMKRVCTGVPKLPELFSRLVPVVPPGACSGGTVLPLSEKEMHAHQGASLWISAEPNIVSPGERAQLSWSAPSDIQPETCAVLGPGLALQSARGRASTAPISAPALFEFTCVARSGATTTTSVLVELAL